jgi:hypothetical protein
MYRYTALNVHHIGIEAPVSYVFELLNWNGDSSCWPLVLPKLNELMMRLTPFNFCHLLGKGNLWDSEAALLLFDLSHYFN